MATLSESGAPSYPLIRNGYFNPDRSEKLNYWLDQFSGKKRSWEVNPNITCSEQKETMVHFAKMILIVGLLLVAATVVESILFQAHPLVYSQTLSLVITISGGALALGSFVAALVLAVKPYWKDPAYRQEEREKIIQSCVDGNIQSVLADEERWKKYDLFSKAELSAISFDPQKGFDTPEMSYLEKCDDPVTPVQKLEEEGELAPQSISPKLLAEIRDNCNGDLSTFVELYGWEPFCEGVIDANSKVPLTEGEVGKSPTVVEYFRDSIEREVEKDFHAFATQTFDWNSSDSALPFLAELIAPDNPHVVSGFRSYLRDCGLRNEEEYSFTFYCSVYHEMACNLNWIQTDEWIGNDIKILFLAYQRSKDDYQKSIDTINEETQKAIDKAKEAAREVHEAVHELEVIQGTSGSPTGPQSNDHHRQTDEELRKSVAEIESEKLKREDQAEKELTQNFNDLNLTWQRYVKGHPEKFPTPAAC